MNHFDAIITTPHPAEAVPTLPRSPTNLPRTNPANPASSFHPPSGTPHPPSPHTIPQFTNHPPGFRSIPIHRRDTGRSPPCRIVGVNAPSNYSMGRILDIALTADVMALYEVGRTPDDLIQAARVKGWKVIVHDAAQTPTQRVTAALLLRDSTPVDVKGTGSIRGCAWADVCFEGRMARVASVYIPCSLPLKDQKRASQGLLSVARAARADYCILGDFNVRTSPQASSGLNGLHGREWIQGRTTYIRGYVMSSLDRVYTPRVSRFSLDQVIFRAVSDHAVLNVTWDVAVSRILPAMARPVGHNPIDGCTIDQIDDQMFRNRRVGNERSRPNKVRRLQKAIEERLARRALTQEGSKQRAELNKEIRSLRKAIDVWDMVGVDPTAKPRYPYRPPQYRNPSELVEYNRLRFLSPAGLTPTPEAVPITITGAMVKSAAQTLRRGARTTDFSARYLDLFTDQSFDTTATAFNQWITLDHIPDRYATSWLIMLKKGGKRGDAPSHYRYVSIMSLYLKLLHQLAYLLVRPGALAKL
eukprot:Sspe_Gene.44433::Locus_21790_Transcript_1_2_Confidence_0.750_Length_3077::g.44433::m.44433